MSYTTFNTDQLVWGDRAIVSSVIVRASSDAVVNLHDSTDNSGPIVIPIAVKAGETVSISADVAFNSGVYVDVSSGSVVGTVVFE